MCICICNTLGIFTCFIEILIPIASLPTYLLMYQYSIHVFNNNFIFDIVLLLYEVLLQKEQSLLYITMVY